MASSIFPHRLLLGIPSPPATDAATSEPPSPTSAATLAGCPAAYSVAAFLESPTLSRSLSPAGSSSPSFSSTPPRSPSPIRLPSPTTPFCWQPACASLVACDQGDGRLLHPMWSDLQAPYHLTSTDGWVFCVTRHTLQHCQTLWQMVQVQPDHSTVEIMFCDPTVETAAVISGVLATITPPFTVDVSNPDVPWREALLLAKKYDITLASASLLRLLELHGVNRNKLPHVYLIAASVGEYRLALRAGLQMLALCEPPCLDDYPHLRGHIPAEYYIAYASASTADLCEDPSICFVKGVKCKEKGKSRQAALKTLFEQVATGREQ